MYIFEIVTNVIHLQIGQVRIKNEIFHSGHMHYIRTPLTSFVRAAAKEKKDTTE